MSGRRGTVIAVALSLVTARPLIRVGAVPISATTSISCGHVRGFLAPTMVAITLASVHCNSAGATARLGANRTLQSHNPLAFLLCAERRFLTVLQRYRDHVVRRRNGRRQ